MWNSQELAVSDVGHVPRSEQILRNLLVVVMVPAVLPLMAYGWLLGQHRTSSSTS